MALDLNALTTKEAVTAIFVGYFNRAPAPAGLNYWVQDITTNGYSLADVARAFAVQSESQALYPGLGTEGTANLAANVAFVTEIFQNLFGRDPSNLDVDGGAGNFWVNELQNGADVGQLILNIMSGAQGADLAVLENKIEVGLAYSDASEAAGIMGQTPGTHTILDNVDASDASVAGALGTIDALFPAPGVPGAEFFLTSGTDAGADFVGTDNDDTFYGYIAQNPMLGGVSNTLSSADRLDGGAGYDRLYAEVSSEFVGAGVQTLDIQPRLKNIEKIEIEARDGGSDYQDEGVEVVIDGKHITDHIEFGSYKSDGDLKFENMTTKTADGSVRNTSELTVTMDHTDNFNSDRDASDLTVLFDNDYLLSGQTSVGFADFFLLDQDAELRLLRGQPAEGRLDKIDKNGIRFEINGKVVVVDFDGALINENNPAEINSHDAFIAALQASLNAQIADGTLPVGTKIVAFDHDGVIFDGDNLALNRAGLQDGSFSNLIPAIRVISGDGSPVVPLGYTAPDEVTGEFNVFGRFDKDAKTSEQPISINIDLYKVGRGGEGGDLVIGGKTANTPDGIAAGIEVFNINVRGAGNNDPDGGMTKPSNLGTVTSTGRALEDVNIKTDPNDAAGSTYASLTIRNGFNEIDNGDDYYGLESGDLKTIDASQFLGDLTLGTADYAPIKSDSPVSTGSARVINADTITATGGGNVELNLFYSGSEDNQQYRVNTGSGADKINALIDGDAVDAVTEGLAISTGAGKDSVIVEVADSFGYNWAGNPGFTDFGSAITSGQMDADGVSLATTDRLKNLSIDTGADEDYVEVRGMGNWAIDTGSHSDTVFINSGGVKGAGDLWNTSGPSKFASMVLYKAKLAISVAGFESVVEINTGSDFILNEAELNVAILAAIEASPEIKQLLVASVGTSDQNLLVQALIDGNNQAGFQILQPELIATGTPLAGSTQVVLNASDVAGMTRDLVANGKTPGGTLVPDSTTVDTAAEIVGFYNDTAGGMFGNSTAADGYAGQIFSWTSVTNAPTGTVGGVSNNSVINVGTGANDLVILSANHNSASGVPGGVGSSNTLVFDDLNAGKVSVVNWFDQASTANLITNSLAGTQAVNGNHLLDFTEFLDAKYTLSGGTASEVVEAIVVKAGAAATALEANSLNFMTVDGLEAMTGSPVGGYSFDTLNAAQVKALVEAAGGITYGPETASTGSGAGFAQGTTVRNSILAIENVDVEGGANQLDGTNYGEYKFFLVSYGMAAEAATSTVQVSEITTVDFGASLDILGGALDANIVGTVAYDSTLINH